MEKLYDGSKYFPLEKRTGNKSIVYFTRDLSANGLKKIYEKVKEGINGKIAVKLHTGEPEGPNIIPAEWVKELLNEKLPKATIIETNTYYEGGRYTTEDHRKTLKINGWDFCDVDITDSEGITTLPVKDGKWFKEIHVGKSMLNYDSLLVLTHFKGHVQGGFGGSNKNIGIGCADGREGKKEIHTEKGSSNKWGILKEEFMERITESTKGTVDYFKNHISFINVMRNMSVSCDCEGVDAEPVVTPDVGILASLDILAVDQACVDIIYNMKNHAGKHMIERIESRHGLRQLSYMKELGMGNDLYTIIDLDNDSVEISMENLVKDINSKWVPDKYNKFKGRNNI